MRRRRMRMGSCIFNTVARIPLVMMPKEEEEEKWW